MTDRPAWLKWLTALHRDERGAEGLEKVLIIAAVALPLLGLLIAYRKEINRWVNDTWGEVRTEGEQPFDQPF
ncbi:MAG: hypothetical protein DWB45_12660 [Xanthomonadales bacterium]|nr:hypothetical protein [Xanthomonadales bacterium]MCK6484704.1 hypothetical protein [Phycisphaerae bacterium]NUQ45978.1 hypothetical protein [Phycisphaerae bacterium]